jgi:toxin ParE1/3/4
MARNVVWTDAALDDIDHIAEYIAIDSPHYAASFVRSIQKSGASLELFSERGRKVPEFDNSSVRELRIGNYRLIYLLQANTASILTIVYTSRDLDGLLASLEL